jgi:hypothetical protein
VTTRGQAQGCLAAEGALCLRLESSGWLDSCHKISRVGLSPRATEIQGLPIFTRMGFINFATDVRETPHAYVSTRVDVLMSAALSHCFPGVVQRGCQPPQPRRLFMVPGRHSRGGGPDQLWAPRPPVGHPLGGPGPGPGRNQPEQP